MRSVFVTALLTVALALGGMYWLTSQSLSDTGFCRAEVGEIATEIDLEQAKWVSLMASIAHRRDLPPRATTIAIATAWQESKIHNIDYGDRDSIGLFQQRPSQGWGSVDQIMDPEYSTNTFYDALVKIPGYQDMEITAAAQAVQRSAFPEAYAQHEPSARALASALRGHSPAAFACAIEPTGGSVKAVVAELEKHFGKNPVAIDERTITVKIDEPEEGSGARGWSITQNLVANAAAWGVVEVTHDGHRWRAKERVAEWRTTKKSSRTTVVFRIG